MVSLKDEAVGSVGCVDIQDGVYRFWLLGARVGGSHTTPSGHEVIAIQ